MTKTRISCQQVHEGALQDLVSLHERCIDEIVENAVNREALSPPRNAHDILERHDLVLKRKVNICSGSSSVPSDRGRDVMYHASYQVIKSEAAGFSDAQLEDIAKRAHFPIIRAVCEARCSEDPISTFAQTIGKTIKVRIDSTIYAAALLRLVAAHPHIMSEINPASRSHPESYFKEKKQQRCTISDLNQSIADRVWQNREEILLRPIEEISEHIIYDASMVCYTRRDQVGVFSRPKRWPFRFREVKQEYEDSIRAIVDPIKKKIYEGAMRLLNTIHKCIQDGGKDQRVLIRNQGPFHISSSVYAVILGEAGAYARNQIRSVYEQKGKIVRTNLSMLINMACMDQGDDLVFVAGRGIGRHKRVLIPKNNPHLANTTRYVPFILAAIGSYYRAAGEILEDRSQGTS